MTNSRTSGKRFLSGWMRAAVAAVLVLSLILPCAVFAASYCPYCGKKVADPAYRFCPSCGAALDGGSNAEEDYDYSWDYVTYGLTINKLATRFGPSTSYQESGTYQVKGQYVPVYSMATDRGGVTWVQCEVTYGGTLHRLYTGLKRFDSSTMDLDAVRVESVLGYGKLIKTSKEMFRDGPGAAYGQTRENTPASKNVSILWYEDGWVQVECTAGEKIWRSWTPESNLK